VLLKQGEPVYGFDADVAFSAEVIVDKMEAARLQLESSITMFFNNWDVVSQNTLVCAAYGILYDLARQRGVKGSIKDSPLVDPEERKDFLNGMNYPQNYFKHADRDGETKLIFRYHGTHLLLFDGLRLFILLDGKVTRKLRVFLMWFQLRYPDLFCLPSAEEDLKKIRQGVEDPEGFMKLARALLEED